MREVISFNNLIASPEAVKQLYMNMIVITFSVEAIFIDIILIKVIDSKV